MASKKYRSKIRNVKNVPLYAWGLLSPFVIIFVIIVFGIPYYKKITGK